jgi:hypothetical protein
MNISITFANKQTVMRFSNMVDDDSTVVYGLPSVFSISNGKINNNPFDSLIPDMPKISKKVHSMTQNRMQEDFAFDNTHRTFIMNSKTTKMTDLERIDERLKKFIKRDQTNKELAIVIEEHNYKSFLSALEPINLDPARNGTLLDLIPNDIYLNELNKYLKTYA